MVENTLNEINTNEFASSLAEVLYENQIQAVVRTLERFRVSERAYTILGDRDESACLTYYQGKWKVYFSERGHESDCRVMNEIEEACRALLYKLSEDDEEYKQMIYCFSNELRSFSDSRFSSTDFYKAVKEGLYRFGRSVAVL